MRRLALIAPLFLTASAHAQPGFWLTHTPGDLWEGRVYGLSQNGSMAVGVSWGPDDLFPGFSWTVAGGRYDFGLDPEMPDGTPVSDVSSDGSIIVGYTVEETKPFEYKYRAYRRVGNGPLENLGIVGNWIRSIAVDVSGDGQIVVGSCESGGSDYTSVIGVPFRWTAETGMVGLGHLKPKGTRTQALGISRDGTTIVGSSEYDAMHPKTEAYVWTAQTGMVQLPGLPTEPVDNYGAEAANADGSVIVGWISGEAVNENHPVRWVNGEIQHLGTFGPKGGGRMYAVDDAGNVIGGRGPGPTIWTPATGLMHLEDYLADFGLKCPDGLTLFEVTSISGDGLTFGGWAHDKSNHPCGFVATIPAPCDADCDQSGTLDIDDFICFQTLFGFGDALADCDKSGDLDFDDFTCFMTKFVAGCP